MGNNPSTSTSRNTSSSQYGVSESVQRIGDSLPVGPVHDTENPQPGETQIGKKDAVKSLMVIDGGKRYLSISDFNSRIEVRVIQREEAELLRQIYGRTPKVTYRREPNGQVSRNSRRFGLMPKDIAEGIMSTVFDVAQRDDWGVSHGWPSLKPYSNEMPIGRIVCYLMAKPEDVLALCLFKHGFSERGLEERYGCDYFSIGNATNGDMKFGFGACTLYQEEGVVLFSVQKLELFSEVGEAYWDSNHISHFWV